MRARAKKTGVCFYSPHATSLYDEVSPGGHGGSELVMFHLACELSRRDRYDVHFLVRVLPDIRKDGCAIVLHEFAGGIPKGQGPRLVSIFANARRIIRSFTDTGARAHVFCGASAVLGYMSLYSLVSRRHKVIFVVASDMEVDGTTRGSTRVDRLLYGLGIRYASIILCQNRHQQEQMRVRFKRKADILPNGLPIPEEPPSAVKRHVLWVSSCQQLKQPHAYLDLAERFPETPFVMIMPPRGDRELFESVAARAGSMDNVSLLDGVHYRGIQRYYDEALVFVNTSTVEGYPNTFVQAMIGAAPILSLNVDPNGILGEHKLGVCARGDEQALAEGLAALLDSSSQREEMGERAFRYAREHHDIERAADALAAHL